MNFVETMKERYKNREDKDNMCCVGITDGEFKRWLIDYLLGEDWFISAPVGRTQENEIILCRILELYSKRYKKERREAERRNKHGKHIRNLLG